MADITWIKLRTNMFDDEKIRLIERMPEGDSILIIWIKLLAYAGKVNCNGYIMINENIPMNIEQVSIIFNRSFEKVKYAISVLQKFGMLDVTEEEIIAITNWEKHQNIEGLDKIRMQARERKRKERERKKTLLLDNNSHVTVTPSHATDIEKEKEKEKDKTYVQQVELLPPDEIDLTEIHFKKFWDTYNKKQDIAKARKSFAKVIKKHDIDTIIEHTLKYLDFLKAKYGNYTYQKMATTFLNNFDLEDDFSVKEQNQVQQNSREFYSNKESNKWGI